MESLLVWDGKATLRHESQFVGLYGGMKIHEFQMESCLLSSQVDLASTVLETGRGTSPAAPGRPLAPARCLLPRPHHPTVRGGGCWGEDGRVKKPPQASILFETGASTATTGCCRALLGDCKRSLNPPPTTPTASRDLIDRSCFVDSPILPVHAHSRLIAAPRPFKAVLIDPN